MKRIALAALSLFLGAPFTSSLFASSTLRLTLKEQIAAAAAICHGTVINVAAFRDERDQAVKTAALIKVDEVLKGTFPAVVRLVHDGGTLGGTGSLDGFAPRMRAGERRLFFLGRRPDGFVEAVNGFASALPLDADHAAGDQRVLAIRGLLDKNTAGDDLRDQSVDWFEPVPVPPVQSLDATGLLVDLGTGVPSRYLLPDRGEAIEYLIDAQTLPAGLSLNQCLGAVTNALSAWSAVTGITFRYGGLQNFGQASPNIEANDQRLRIQLHDLYNYISSGSTLGRGGRSYSISGAFPAGGLGGRVTDQEFYPNNCGYVVLNHRAASMQTLKTFEEVLCHEIGHALGMAHSSENPGETNLTRREAIMYYLAHADGRGATLGAYDPPIAQKAHPPGNTPPYGFDRVMDVVTSSPQPNVTGVNSVQISGFDRQGDSLTVALSNQSVPGNGAFSLQGDLLKYTPANAWSDSGRDDPAGGSVRDAVFVRFSDGTHASPYVKVRVLSFNFDNQPAGNSDGLPNWWAQQYFGSTTPLAANLSRAQDDKDGDGLTNLEEWLAGTDPVVANSNLSISGYDGSILTFTARPYDLYELVSSTDFNAWTRVNNPLLPTVAAGSVTGLEASAPAAFYQIRRVP